MSQKLSRNQRRKLAAEAAQAANPTPTPAEVVRQRRNRRLIFIAAALISIPLLEVIAYHYRSILIIVINRSDETITNVKFTYPGGSFEVKELKPGGEMTHLARPNFTFNRSNFSTYPTRVAATASSGTFSLNEVRTGTVDYSARETYTIEANGETKALKFKHTSRPGIPLSTVRDLMARMGIG